MADLVLVAVIVAFTLLCVAYISWCDRIIGSDEPMSASEPAANAEPATVTATVTA